MPTAIERSPTKNLAALKLLQNSLDQPSANRRNGTQYPRAANTTPVVVHETPVVKTRVHIPATDGSYRQAPNIPQSVPRNLPKGLPTGANYKPIEAPRPPQPVNKPNVIQRIPQAAANLGDRAIELAKTPVNRQTVGNLANRASNLGDRIGNNAGRAAGALALGSELVKLHQRPSLARAASAIGGGLLLIPNPYAQGAGLILSVLGTIGQMFESPENISPNPNIILPPFSGGQSIGTIYRITYTLTYKYQGQIESLTRESAVDIKGAIIGNMRPQSGSSAPSFEVLTSNGWILIDQALNLNIAEFVSCVLISVRRKDNESDTGGDLPTGTEGLPAQVVNSNEDGFAPFDFEALRDKVNGIDAAVRDRSFSDSQKDEILSAIKNLVPSANNGVKPRAENRTPEPLLNPNNRKDDLTATNQSQNKPLFNPFENGNIPSFEASPFVSGVSHPDDQFNPRDTRTGLTREQFDQKILEERQKTRDKQEANRIAAKKNDDKINALLNPVTETNITQLTRIPKTPLTPFSITDKIGEVLRQTQPLLSNLPPVVNPKSINERFKQNDCCPPQISTITVKKFDKCENGSPVFVFDSISVLQGTELLNARLFEEIADFQAMQCNETACYAAVPEWWQIRPEGKRPQLVLQFCAKLPNGKYGPPKYALTIPHPRNTQKPLSAPLPKYKKGNFEGELKLADNSKIIVNCETKAEAERVLNLLKNLVKQNMLEGSTTKFSERRGKEVQKHEMLARIATYFEKGIEDSADFKWKKSFDLPNS